MVFWVLFIFRKRRANGKNYWRLMGLREWGSLQVTHGKSQQIVGRTGRGWGNLSATTVRTRWRLCSMWFRIVRWPCMSGIIWYSWCSQVASLSSMEISSTGWSWTSLKSLGILRTSGGILYGQPCVGFCGSATIAMFFMQILRDRQGLDWLFFIACSAWNMQGRLQACLLLMRCMQNFHQSV